MKKVLILVEGQTDETVVRDVLAPHLSSKGIALVPVIVKTKRDKTGKAFKGGISSFDQVHRDLKPLLRDGSAIGVTTLLDYYGLPNDFPGMKDRPPKDAYARVAHVEAEFAKAVNNRKFVAHLTLHEIEAWIYVDPKAAEWVFENQKVPLRLKEIRASCGGAELVDEGPETAPSKRILAIAPEFEKAIHGPMAIEAVGIDQIRTACQHADAWLRTIEAL